jgi:hypothetical protein
VRHALEQVAVPGEDDARERAWGVVLEAYGAREPVPRRRRAPLLAIGAAAVAAASLAVASPPGQAVVDRVRELVGVERAQPALFSLPGGGRLLVNAADGTWVVAANGKKRLLSGYWDASWSPFGRFIVAVRTNELAALEADGDIRWTLSRPDVHSPRWAGTATDTKIAYVDRSGLRVVAGDGTGDRLLAPSEQEQGPLAWRPGPGFVLASVSRNGITVRDTETGRVRWRRTAGLTPRLHTDLGWSSDGRRLLVVNRGIVQVFDARGRAVVRSEPSAGWVSDAIFLPGTQRVLVARTQGRESAVADLATGRAIFAVTGVFDEITASPDGRRLVVEWRTADQWVFVRTDGRRAIRAVSGIAGQFRGKAVIGGWCCS